MYQLPPLGLYIHLPWCEKKCPYCDFNSHQASSVPEDAYIDTLLRDLDADLPSVRGRPIETLFIGGGTPSLFSAQAIDRLMQGISARLELAPSFEATMEANPGSAEADKFRGFRQAGINRLSLGIQSFQDSQLQALGRVHSSDEAHAAIEMVKAAQFDSFNIDLMHGLPDQTRAAGIADLETALGYHPPHLSWYQLTIEPNTVFHNRPPTLPVEDTLADIQQRGEAVLAGAGYKQYEVSAYSRSDFNCRHNLNYWSFGDYLGIGAGAHGKISYADGSIQRYAKRRQPEQYMAADNASFAAQSHYLDAGEIRAEFILNALRLNRGFSLSHFTRSTGLAADTLQPQLDRLIDDELLILSDGQVATTELGRRFLDTVVAEFLSD